MACSTARPTSGAETHWLEQPADPTSNAWPVSQQRAWAGEEKLDMAKYNEYKKTVIENFRKHQGDNPPVVTFFPEPHISRDLTAGNPPDYWGDPPYEMNEAGHSQAV